MILFAHVLSAALWLGAAITLPFWGNRVKRADNLPMVLGIADTVLAIKCILIMGGLLGTLTTGIVLTEKNNLPYFSFDPVYSWLGISQFMFIIIAMNASIILYLMIYGKKGQRSFYRYVPPIGYNNLALIFLLYLQMTAKPSLEQQMYFFFIPLLLLISIDTLYFIKRMLKSKRLKNLSYTDFAKHYFQLLNDENMYELLRLFNDTATIIDPFATGPVNGLVKIEQFFQSLGDQFESIKILPQKIIGDNSMFTIHWKAHGVTKNGIKMEELLGTNTITRQNGRIKKMNIKFNVSELPQIEFFRV